MCIVNVCGQCLDVSAHVSMSKPHLAMSNIQMCLDTVSIHVQMFLHIKTTMTRHIFVMPIVVNGNIAFIRSH